MTKSSVQCLPASTRISWKCCQRYLCFVSRVVGFLIALRTVQSTEGAAWERILQDEGKLIAQLIALGDNAKAKGGKVEKKKERLKASLAPDGEFKDLRVFPEPVR